METKDLDAFVLSIVLLASALVFRPFGIYFEGAFIGTFAYFIYKRVNIIWAILGLGGILAFLFDPVLFPISWTKNIIMASICSGFFLLGTCLKHIQRKDILGFIPTLNKSVFLTTVTLSFLTFPLIYPYLLEYGFQYESNPIMASLVSSGGLLYFIPFFALIWGGYYVLMFPILGKFEKRFPSRGDFLLVRSLALWLALTLIIFDFINDLLLVTVGYGIPFQQLAFINNMFGFTIPYTPIILVNGLVFFGIFLVVWGGRKWISA